MIRSENGLIKKRNDSWSRAPRKEKRYVSSSPIICTMRIHFLVWFLSIHRIYGHGEHGNDIQGPASGPAHISRKMENLVHDMR